MIHKLLIFMAFFLTLITDRAYGTSYTISDLGPDGSRTSEALDINDRGEIVGIMNTWSRNDHHAIIWKKGDVIDLGTMGEKTSYASGINNKGEIVGQTSTPNDSRHAVLWFNNNANTIPELEIATDINDSGDVLGFIGTDGPLHSVVYSKGTITDNGVGNYYSLNNKGELVGWDSGKPILKSRGTVINLGSSGGAALGINDHSEIVGFVSIGNGISHAMLWANGVATDLNETITHDGWTQLSEAAGINNLGQIVGNGIINGETHAFLLTPDSTPIPEPSTLLMFGVGLLGLAVRSRRIKV